MTANVNELIFSALHALHATRSSYDQALCPSVRPSVCPSVKRVICDKMKETCATILIPHERTSILVLETRKIFGGKQPLTLNFGSKLPSGANTPIFNRYSLVALQP